MISSKKGLSITDVPGSLIFWGIVLLIILGIIGYTLGPQILSGIGRVITRLLFP